MIKDYFDAVRVYYEQIDQNDMLSDKEKRIAPEGFSRFLKGGAYHHHRIWKKTYVIRNIEDYFGEVLATCREKKFDREALKRRSLKLLSSSPLLAPEADKRETAGNLYLSLRPGFMEKKILYYNFIERDIMVTGGKKPSRMRRVI